MKALMTMRNAVCEDEASVEPPWSMVGVAKLQGGAMCLISLGSLFCPSWKWTWTVWPAECQLQAECRCWFLSLAQCPEFSIIFISAS